MTQLEQPDGEYKTDMTPMIDVVFLLIVFFICIDFKVLEAKLDAWLPTDKGSSDKTVEIVEQLSVRVLVDDQGMKLYPNGQMLNPNTERASRYQLQGHTVRFEVGVHMCNTLTQAKEQLARIATDPSLMIPDPETGGRKVMACVVEGFPGTCYDDVARAADVCRAAGFDEIQFGGGMGQLPRVR
ncbi:MAG: biopolymer transport protein ExbD [Planctomycetota bacterium]|jgi:biopolymer transport protein ExbD